MVINIGLNMNKTVWKKKLCEVWKKLSEDNRKQNNTNKERLKLAVSNNLLNSCVKNANLKKV